MKTYEQVSQKKDTILPGEKKAVKTNVGLTTEYLQVRYDRVGSAKTLRWTFARILSMVRNKSFKGGAMAKITVDGLQNSQLYLIKQAQKTVEADKKSRYKNLQPIINDKGVWTIGHRLSEYNPLTSSDSPLILIPSNEPLSTLLMKEAHVKSGHRGRDATLARFRMCYWTPKGAKIAKAVVRDCQACKLREPKLSTQLMGGFPTDRLKPALPFSRVMLDLFGPYQVKGEVQKRTSGKVYGVLFTDLASRAVHIETSVGYDTGSFMQALRRFNKLKGLASEDIFRPRITAGPYQQRVAGHME